MPCNPSTRVDQPHTVKRGGSVYYYLADGPGNVVGLLDASGTLVNEYHYSPWGEAEVEREGVAQPYRFTGRTWDRETGLYDYRARWYDPALGRFVSEDPIGLAGGINPYAYVGNDPVNGRDPSGLSECWRVSGWGAGVAVNGPGGQVLGHTDASGDFTNCRGGDQQFGTLWTHHIFGSAAYGRPGSLTDPADEEAFRQAEQQAREDERKGELLAQAVRSTRGTADLESDLLPDIVYRDGAFCFDDPNMLCVGIPIVAGRAAAQAAFDGLITPARYFGSRTLAEIERALTVKFGSPRSIRATAKTWFNPRSGRSYNVHHDPLHRGGMPHVDIRRRGGFPERKYDLWP